MKKIVSLLTFLMFFFLGCTDGEQKVSMLEQQVHQLQQQLNLQYKPGFGDLMGRLQVHHAKLWFAGMTTNWKLAVFELHEMNEILTDLRQFHPERQETRELTMMEPELQALSVAIQHQNKKNFQQKFYHLTHTCNQCHQITHYEFIVIQIPEKPPIGNQQFGLN